jgi:hypothetical protein
MSPSKKKWPVKEKKINSSTDVQIMVLQLQGNQS